MAAGEKSWTEDERTMADLAARPLDPADEQALARLLAHPAKALRLRAATLFAEALSGGDSPPAMTDRLLASSDGAVRWGAAFASSRAGVVTPRVLDVAVEALDADDGDVRWAAASIVTQEARGSAGLRMRLRSLSTDGTPRSRKMALLCLCDSGGSEGDTYRHALGDEDPFVRLAAATCLARSGDRSPDSLAALRTVSEADADPRVRRGASALLSRLAPRTN